MIRVLLALVPVFLVVILTPASVPEVSTYPVDLARVRALAGNEGPLRMRSLDVARSHAPRLIVVPSFTLERNHFIHYSYQAVYADQRSVVIDAVNDEALLDQGFPGGSVSVEKYTQMQRAMEHASAIVVTHEHFDHIGGIAHAEHFDAIAPRVLLTVEQLGNPRLAQAGFSTEQVQKLKPLAYDRLHVLAPGIVLIKAPGHTPGSQMVFVRLASGTELLLVGDIAWHRDNIALPRMHPRGVNWGAHEDSTQMGHQLRWLHELQEQEPALHLVVAHDGDQMRELVGKGVFLDGFE